MLRRRAFGSASLECPPPEGKNSADNDVDNDTDNSAYDNTDDDEGGDFNNIRPMPSEEESGEEEGRWVGWFVVLLRRCGDNAPEERSTASADEDNNLDNKTTMVGRRTTTT